MADFTREEWIKFNSATHSYMKNRSQKMTHGYAIWPNDIEALHSNCNLNYKELHYIPIVFHNLSRYDAHFIIKEIATTYEGRVNLLSITKEKYILSTKHVDSTIDKNYQKEICYVLLILLNFSHQV